MKRTLFSIFRNYCATAITPFAVLSIVPSVPAQIIAKKAPVPALGHAAELRPQEQTNLHSEVSEASRGFSFSVLDSNFLSLAKIEELQEPSSRSAQAPSSNLSFQPLPSVQLSQAVVAQNSSDAPQNTTTSDAPQNISTSDIPDYLQNQKPNRVFIGPETFYRNYSEEEITPGFKSFEHGFLYGVKVQYEYVKRNSAYVGADFRYDRGQTSYDGGTVNLETGVITPSSTKTNNEFFNFEGRLGYTFKADKVGRLLLTPFIGYGYQQWNRTITGDGGLEEDYSWNYFAGGLRAEYRPSRRFTVGMNFKLVQPINGNLDLKAPGQIIAAKALPLGGRLQAEVEFPITYHLVDKPKSSIDLRFTPFYRSQNIGRGDSVDALFNLGGGQVGTGSVREPASTTDVYGATFGVVFSF
jgi:Outer membrane protein beta-barrel domain